MLAWQFSQGIAKGPWGFVTWALGAPAGCCETANSGMINMMAAKRFRNRYTVTSSSQLPGIP